MDFTNGRRNGDITVGVKYSPKIVTDGLVLALDAANTKSYPGSGTTWSDLSGNGNNGTLTNGPTFDSGNLGSISLDGVNDYVVKDNRVMPATLYPFSYSGWFKTSRTGVVQSLITVLDRGVSNRFWTLLLQTNNTLIVERRNTTSYFTSLNNNALPLNTWFHAHINFNNTTSVQGFVNGQQTVNSTIETAVTGPTTANDILLGLLRTSSPVYYLEGNITNVLLYNKILTASEVLQNYNATKGRFGL